MSDLDTEWIEALGEEPETPIKEEEAPADDNGDNSEDTSSDDADNASDNSDDTRERDTETKEEEESDAKEDETPEENTPPEEDPTKKAVKEALQEIETDRSSRMAEIDSIKQAAMEKLYPNGIDRQLRDSDGDPITGIDDLTKLVNPATNDYFTEEEAGRWLLENQQRLNKEVEQAERYVEQVAEVNQNLNEGARRVHDKYPEQMADEKIRTRLLDAYNKTLVKDPETGVIVKTPIDIEEFFDIALENRAVAPPPEPAPKPKPAPTERGDFKPKGNPDNDIDPDDKEWAMAYKEYEEGV